MKNWLLCLFAAGALVSSTSTAQTQNSFETYLHLRLTHSLFQGVFASYFAEKDDSYDSRYQVNKVYLQTFMNTWAQLIENGKYKTTQEIFAQMSRENGYLARYFSKWESVLSYRAADGKIDLGGVREQFLYWVLLSETKFPQLDERIQYILEITNLYIVTTANDYNLGYTIASAFVKSKNPKTQKSAEGIASNISFQKKANVVIAAYDILSVLSVGGAFKSLNLLGASQFLARPLSPILSKLTSVRGGYVASGALHAGALGGALYVGLAHDASSKDQGNSQSVAITLANLETMLEAVYPDTFPEKDLNDFTSAFSPLSQDQVIRELREHLLNGKKIDYGEEILAVEKLKKIDQRDSTDLFAMDYANNFYEEMKSKTAKIFASDRNAQEKIEAFRRMFIEGVGHSYKRDYAALVPMLLGWGGNCMAEAELMISLLEPYQNRLPAPLVIALWNGHIEASLFDGQNLTTLIAGKETSEFKATLYKPKFLMLLLLRAFPGAPKDLEDLDLHVLPHHRKESIFSTVEGLVANHLRQPLSVLENVRPNDVDPDSDPIDLSAVPESAALNYSAITKADHDSPGDFADRLSRLRGGGGNVQRSNDPPLSVNFDPQSGLQFMRFTYDWSKNTVTAFDERTFLDFSRAKHDPRMNRALLINILDQKRVEALARFVRLPLVEKVYRDPHRQNGLAADLDVLAQLSYDELEKLKKLINEFGWFETDYFQIFYEWGRIDFARWDRFAAETYETNRGARVDVDTAVRLKDIADGEVALLKDIIRDPRTFLEFYNRASDKLRNHILLRFIGTSYWNYNKLEGTDANLRKMVRAKLRDYVNRLSEVKVDFSKETDWICNKIKINSPRVGANWPWLEKPDLSCGDLSQSTTQAGKESLDSKNPAAQNRDVLELKVSTLIELTIGFGRGLHLWNKQVVDAFVDGRYSEIGPDRNASIAAIYSIYQSDPAFTNDPTFQRLSELALKNSTMTEANQTYHYDKRFQKNTY